MSVKVHARFTLRVVSRGQAKRAVDAAAAHGFHNCRDHDLPVPGVWRNSHSSPRGEDFQGKAVPAREYSACRKVPARRFVLLVPLSGETRVRRVRTNNKTGVGHFAFLYLSEN
jgi:hypothetical protein